MEVSVFYFYFSSFSDVNKWMEETGFRRFYQTNSFPTVTYIGAILYEKGVGCFYFRASTPCQPAQSAPAEMGRNLFAWWKVSACPRASLPRA